ncbi:MAG: DUF3021 domain-containing protein [Clostridia bacterium]|nr:DUF3021 domain-containing protein [Clostridia bacterium]
MKHSPITTRPVRDFFFRGLLFGGFGPIIAGIVYLILHFTLQDLTLTGLQVFTVTVSTYLLAFVHAGASVFNQIESWPLAKSTLCHFGLLYIAYVLCYLINSWIPFEPLVLGIFTAIFAVGYAVIWLAVYVSIRMTVKRLNRSLR